MSDRYYAKKSGSWGIQILDREQEVRDFLVPRGAPAEVRHHSVASFVDPSVVSKILAALNTREET